MRLSNQNEFETPDVKQRTFKGFEKVMNGEREMREEEKQWLRLKFKYRD